MGKKPLFAIVGLVWAGIALTGCGTCGSCCRDCPSKHQSKPAFGARNTKTDADVAPNMMGEARPASTPDMGAARIAETPPAVGASRSPIIEQTSGTTTGGPSGIVPATPSSFNKTTGQSSLRPTDDRGMSSGITPAAPAAQRPLDDGFPARTTNVNEGRTMAMPPRPVTTTTNTTTPSMTTNTPTPTPSLPGRELPSLNSTTGTPPPPPAAFDNGNPPPPPAAYLPPGK